MSYNDFDHEHPASKLVRYTARAFYDDLHIIILDTLLEVKEIEETNLASMLNVQQKNCLKTLNDLKSQHLVSSYQMKKKPTIWFIDFKLFHDAVKLRMHHLKRACEEKSTLQVRYLCTNPRCEFEYDTFEIIALTDMTTGRIFCKRCKSEVDELANNMNSAENGGDLLENRFQIQLKNIIKCLEELENMVVPERSRRYASEIITEQKYLSKKYEIEKAMEREISMGENYHARITSAQNIQKSAEQLPKKATAERPYFLNKTSEQDAAREYQLLKEKEREEELLSRQQEEKLREKELYRELMMNHIEGMESDAEASTAAAVTSPLISETLSTSDEFDQRLSTEEEEKVFVSVQGVPVPIDQITTEHMDRMTEEEYKDYYEKALIGNTM